MKERPIIFSGEMVKAILEGRKTQTRRVVEPQPPEEVLRSERCSGPDCGDGFHFIAKRGEFREREICEWHCKCPYGVPGDRLWVRETFWHQPADYDLIACTKVKLEDEVVIYRADHDAAGDNFKWRPSIFMPHDLSRITLEITDVRVQRLQEIILEDCLAEGIDVPGRDRMLKIGPIKRECDEAHCRAYFRALWDSINAKKHPWHSDPWVWTITFRRIEEAR